MSAFVRPPFRISLSSFDTDTWDAADTAASWALSNGDKTAYFAANTVKASSHGVLDFDSTSDVYIEVVIDAASAIGAGQFGIGIAITTDGTATSYSDFDHYALADNGALYYDSSITSSWVSALAVNDIVMIAYKGSTGEIWFGVNGTWGGSGNPSTGANPAASGITGTYKLEIGATAAGVARSFTGSIPTTHTHTVPTGFTPVVGG